jgi:hypothetical protein
MHPRLCVPLKLTLVLAAWLLPSLAVAVRASAEGSGAWPRGRVFVPERLFQNKHKLDKVVLESNPRLYLHPEFDPKSDLILVIGMPGWGGRSENFIGCLYNGLGGDGLRKRLVVATIQDTRTRGPRYQGQGDKEHANVWRLDRQATEAIYHFVNRLADDFGHLRVYFMGYSTGSVIAPIISAGVAELASEHKNSKVAVEGSISLGTGSGVNAKRLVASKLRSLFIVVPDQRRKEPKSHRYDQGNRSNAIAAVDRLTKAGVTAHLRFIDSARRHFDWHWGLMSQCRYYKLNRYDDGRGYWPNYWMPNPDSFGYMSIFIQGKTPPEKLANPPQKCPHPPNVNNPEDPDAKVSDPSRQVKWAPGTTVNDKGEPN